MSSKERVPSPILRAFQAVGRDLFLQGLNSSHSGNLSARQQGRIWITRRGAPLGRLEPQDLIPVDPEHPGPVTRSASSELPVHLALYRHPDVRAVVHAHPPAVVALSLSQESIHPVDLEGRHYFGRVAVIAPPTPYDPAQAASSIGEALEMARVVVSRGHGSFSRGENLWEAFHWASALEHACRILLMSRPLGP